MNPRFCQRLPRVGSQTSLSSAVAPCLLAADKKQISPSKSIGRKCGRRWTILLQQDARFHDCRRSLMGSPQSRTSLRNDGRCRYPQPGELERSLLKDCYVHDDAQPFPLAWVSRQAPAGLLLHVGAHAGVRGDATGTSAAAFVRTSAGKHSINALSAGDRTAAAAFRPGSPSAGFVDTPCCGRTPSANGRGGCCIRKHGWRQNQRTFSWWRRRRVRARSADCGLLVSDIAECCAQGVGKKRSTSSLA